MASWGENESLHVWTRGEGQRNHPAFLRSLEKPWATSASRST